MHTKFTGGGFIVGPDPNLTPGRKILGIIKERHAQC